jgi:predicted XRE-type DNA-binding protein
MTKRNTKTTPVEMSDSSVYAQLGYPDADDMLIKAQLVSKIAEIVKRKSLTQTEAAELLGLTQPKLSRILRGDFRGVSERRLMDCLTKLGRDVQIVVKERSRAKDTGKVSIVFA